MRSMSTTQPQTPSTWRLSRAARWLVAGLLYTGSLLLVWLDLLAAVFALFASLVCLPEVRAALRTCAGTRARLAHFMRDARNIESGVPSVGGSCRFSS